MIPPLSTPPTRLPPWDAQALEQRLQPLLPGVCVRVLDTAVSTNSVLLDEARAASGASTRGAGAALVRASVESRAYAGAHARLDPCLLVAQTQTGGRGRLGRAWQARPGASLTCSLRLPLEVADWSGLSLAVGVALCEALDPAPRAGGGLRLGLKWPNDVWLIDHTHAGRKLGGILIETLSAEGRRQLVVGVGLNILPFDAGALDSGFAALQELDPGASAPGALARLAPALIDALRTFERDGFAAFAPRYAARDLLRGRGVCAQVAGPAGAGTVLAEGIAQGVAEDGALLVRTAAGVVRVSSGDVRVRLGDAAPTP